MSLWTITTVWFAESIKGENEIITAGVTVDLEDGTCSVGLWEDEETEQFYTEFPNLKDYLPNFKVEKPEIASAPVEVVSWILVVTTLCINIGVNKWFISTK